MSLPDRPGDPVAGVAVRGLPEAAVARLALCHRVLVELAASGVETVRSNDLAAACGVSPANLRKDLSHLGSYGVRGVGYHVPVLIARISEQLGLTAELRVVIVGWGNLGRALAGYPGFPSRGLRVVALVDPAYAGQVVQGPHGAITVAAVEELANVVAASRARIGIIATPAEQAQEAADLLVAAGIHSLLNFAPVTLTVPASIEVRKVDLAVELQILAFHEQQRTEETA